MPHRRDSALRQCLPDVADRIAGAAAGDEMLAAATDDLVLALDAWAAWRDTGGAIGAERAREYRQLVEALADEIRARLELLGAGEG